MDNHIKIYEKNTQAIAVYVVGVPDLTIYVPYLTVKKKASDASALINVAGLVSDPSTTYIFNLTAVDTSLAVGDYCYDITLTGTNTYTLIKDKFTILETVRF